MEIDISAAAIGFLLLTLIVLFVCSFVRKWNTLFKIYFGFAILLSTLPIPVIPATDSGRSRPPVPEEVGRLFRLKPATDSGGSRPPIGAKRRWC
jgi:hypothetical protein